MKITDTNWECPCESIAEKQQLFDYAKAKGVAISRGYFGNVDYYGDDDTTVCYYGVFSSHRGLITFEGHDADMLIITRAEFRRLCDEYATANGVAA